MDAAMLWLRTSDQGRGLLAHRGVVLSLFVANSHIASAEFLFPSTLRTLCHNRRAFSRYSGFWMVSRTARRIFGAELMTGTVDQRD